MGCVINECFICHSILSEGEVTILKERGIKTLINSSAKRKLPAHEQLLKTVNAVSVHIACQKKYNQPKLIAAALRRGSTGFQKETVQLLSNNDKFNFKTHFVFCAKEITDSFREARKKKEMGQEILCTM